MKYLGRAPIFSKPVTKEYEDSWDRVFGGNPNDGREEGGLEQGGGDFAGVGVEAVLRSR